MGTVGLSFGSATSGAGFDVAATVSSILSITQAVETPWKTQIASLQAQDAAFTSLGTSLSSLSTALGTLSDFQGVLASKQGSSSDSSVLTLSSATPAAIAGSHSILVSQLAQTSSTYSGIVANTADPLSGSISIQVGSGASQTITLDSTDNTLATLASAINQGSYGVSASIVSDSSGSRLSLQSSTSGTAGAISVTSNLEDTVSSSALAFTVGQAAQDARFTVDGLSTSSATNTVSGAIPGVSFQLLAPSTTPVQVQIANDNSSIETAVQSMVTAYNAVVAGVKTQEGKDATGSAEPLFGNPTLALIQQQLSASLLGGSASGSIRNIGQLGLSLGQDGRLTLNATTLDAALNTNFADIQGFFQNSGSFGQTLSTALDRLGSSSPSGTVTLALAQNAAGESGLNADVSNEDALIAAQKISLTTELNTANQILQSIPAQLNSVNEIYSAISGYNKSN